MNTDYTIHVASNLITYRFNTPYSAIITVGQNTYNMNFYESVKFSGELNDTLLNLGLTWASIFAVQTKIVNHNRGMVIILPSCTIDNITGNIVS